MSSDRSYLSKNFNDFFGDKGFADPFILPSSGAFPRDFSPSSMDFCAFLYYLNPEYRNAAARVHSHFITDIEFTGRAGSPHEQKRLKEYLRDQLCLWDWQRTQGQEFDAYGNGFTWIFFPFNRYLVDDRSSLREYSMDIFQPGDVKYHYDTMEYEVPDPRTFHLPEAKRQMVRFPFRDRKVSDENRIKLRSLDPRHVILEYNYCSGHVDYIWTFDPEMRNDIEKGVLYQVRDTPMAMLEAIRDKKDFRFNQDQVFHLKASAISGISNSGWGLPEVLANYRSLHHLQVYRRINEAVGMDYVLPFRVLSPNISPDKVGEGAAMTLMSQWKGQMTQMIRNRRADPFAIHALPLPVVMNQFGAEADRLVPIDMMKTQSDMMLDAMGFPAELIRGTMQVQQIPTTMRIFENHFRHLHSGYNRMTQWVTMRVLEWLNAETQECKQQAPSLADDIEKRSIIIQLMAGGEIPRRHGYTMLGLSDPVEAATERAREDMEIAKQQQAIQKDFEREQTMGSMTDQLAAAEASGGEAQQGAAGGAPMGQQLTPLDRGDQIQQEAQAIMGIQDTGQRQKAWDQLRSSNANLYAQVKQRVEELRSGMASQGRAQAGQAAAQAQQTGQPMPV